MSVTAAMRRATRRDSGRSRVAAADRIGDDVKAKQAHLAHFPSAGEVVIFDRSWYNRAGVEPVMGFCAPAAMLCAKRRFAEEHS
jgi:Polyphosphate kinase 2 (PPK2)